MAEFAQIMKDWRRMCKTYSTDDEDCCEGCPVVDFHEHGCSAIYEMEDVTDWRRYAEAIMSWAAEHPVVYPTWGEWFVEHGDLVDGWQNATNAAWMANTALGVFMKPIPADIAQKLGIEPKPEPSRKRLKDQVCSNDYELR